VDGRGFRAQHRDLGDDARHDGAERKPMILTFAAINSHQAQARQTLVPTSVFTAGYLIAWSLFGHGSG
jgi:hypothetical protein